MNVLLLVVRFVVLDIDDYFALMAFQMAWPALQIIAMHHCQKKVMHVLFILRFTVLDAEDYLAFVVFQMARPTMYVAWHVVFSPSDYDIHVQISMCLD